MGKPIEYDRDRAETLYQSGLSLRDVGALLGVNRETLRKQLQNVVRPRLSFLGTPASRILPKLDRTSSPHGCWLWTGMVNNKGYGIAGGEPGRSRLVHRIVYELLVGPAPDGLDACHTCDTPRCANPAHIFFGTHAENMQDAARKGRVARGERVFGAKFTEADIRAAHVLWKSGASLAEAGRAVGITYKHMWQLSRGRGWQHLQLDWSR